MAPTQYYVDNVGGNDTTGNGTVGTPWATAQKALDTITRDATNGDQINIKAGGTEVVAAALSLTTYGTPTQAAPLVFRGYTATAGDGGIGVLSGGGNNRSIFNSSTLDFIHWIDLRLTNCGTSVILRVDADCLIVNCAFDTAADSAVQVGARSLVMGCNVTAVATAATAKYAIQCIGGGRAMGNRLQLALGHADAAAILVGANGVAQNNIIRIGATGNGIITSTNDGSNIANNSIFAVAGTGSGILVASGGNEQVIINNIVEGFSGSGGKGITIAGEAFLYHSNAIYNCATAESIPGVVWISANNDTLSGSAFVNAVSDDFDVNGTVTGVTEDAWPSAYLGASSTTPKADKGASQAGAGTGGGGGPVFGGMVVR